MYSSPLRSSPRRSRFHPTQAAVWVTILIATSLTSGGVLHAAPNAAPNAAPAASTPAASTPATSTPATSTPAASTPAATPAANPPAADAPALPTPRPEARLAAPITDSVASALRADANSASLGALPGVQARYLNRPFATFRSNFLGLTPKVRAEHAEQLLQTVLENKSSSAVGVQANSLGNIITLDGVMLFVLTDADADHVRGETLDDLTRQATADLRRVIVESRESRDARSLLRSLLFAGLETLLLIVLAALLTKVSRWLESKFAIVIVEKAKKLTVGGAELVRGDRVVTVARWLLRLAYWIILLPLIYTWLGHVFARFPYTRIWGEQLNGYLLTTIQTVGSGMVVTIPNLLIVGVTVLLARGLIGLVRPIFDRIESGGAEFGWLDQDTVRPTRKIFNGTIWVFTLVMAYPYLPGANTDAFKGISVLLGLMISLGSSSVVSQGASGLILMYSRTIRRGEFVRIGEHEGTIVEMGMFTTRILTGRGAEISLPNALIIGAATVNYSRTALGKGFMIDTTVTIGYDTPWRQIEAMLLEAASRTHGLTERNPPRVFQTALSDFYPEYCLVAQASTEDPRTRAELLSQLHAHIQDVFNEYGVQIMSPHYLGDPKTAKVVAPADWFPSPAARPTK